MKARCINGPLAGQLIPIDKAERIYHGKHLHLVKYPEIPDIASVDQNETTMKIEYLTYKMEVEFGRDGPVRVSLSFVQEGRV